MECLNPAYAVLYRTAGCHGEGPALPELRDAAAVPSPSAPDFPNLLCEIGPGSPRPNQLSHSSRLALSHPAAARLPVSPVRP